ncbi:class F sortase [Streptomyces sp. NA04227]|uniref:class F sortase n=1 Tax=Streptomyces sp. NA04227 TaxID=2742136 RepID=UPI00159112F4|nr:class F sortase [Streptomyces sp. NA04227]QKW06357.1 class F sortase [Streptomyces sp. NA04227]
MRRISDTCIALVSALALGCGGWLVYSGTQRPGPPQPGAAQAAVATGDGGSDTGTRDGARAAAAPLAPSAPRRIRVPAIRVDAPLTGLGLNARGGLDVPPPGRANLAGWYRGGVSPGERGTALVAGHVDTAHGPAAFYRLGALRRGDRVEVDRADGGAALFAVDAVELYTGRDFPDEKVYGPARRPELRLITCGGGWSKHTGYRGNVVVFAHLTGSRSTGSH